MIRLYLIPLLCLQPKNFFHIKLRILVDVDWLHAHTQVHKRHILYNTINIGAIDLNFKVRTWGNKVDAFVQ